MRELLRHKIREALEKSDYRALARLCLEVLNAEGWLDCWRKMEGVVQRSGEYVLAKFLASAYALAQDEIYTILSPATREFLARDVVVCLEKTTQVLELLSSQEASGDIRGRGGV
ncbi:hypothetical protein [Pyrobaculum neutrophilum]|uniref:PaREP1 family protein n=1 Tax=Pyrobaculum neutrophilum (strain DSM 2338 / JCM 9278 / NBRC 100436 / V24Sta) TaxID=444157 RepID=B1Y9U9_PYRNV|nr:hypothetical protein [Pyrobaculum neutrophilum]ACB40499.1 hypothetical protein Tneu_1575 [Pyrobaculum neutrophilum V24Sta]